MDRLAVGIMIAIAALVMNGDLVRDVFAEERVAPSADAPLKSPAPTMSGCRSERVLSLLLTLEALRAAPGLLTSPKV